MLTRTFSILSSILFLLASCTVGKKIGRSAKEQVINHVSLKNAHVGISIYEPSTGKYWYDHQGERYFVPASNTKIPTCYVAMKYLKDSLVGINYSTSIIGSDTIYVVSPAGDPTFLHNDYKHHPVMDFLNVPGRKLQWLDAKEEFNPMGSGWSWNDYQETYMVERSAFPIYGNIVTIAQGTGGIYTVPKHFIPSVLHKTGVGPGIERSLGENRFYFDSLRPGRQFQLPFISRPAVFDLLKDTISNDLIPSTKNSVHGLELRKVYSQPLDSLLKPMMHRSDNFFAEQCLIMASQALLGKMNDAALRDTIMKTDFKDLPQKPRWADGSGLSRYNLFSPRDMVMILNKIETEFGMDRIKTIFPTGGQGTISSYYKQDSGYFYAKTGTLSGVVALSGFMTTSDNKQLIFSVLVNNHQASATDVRRAIEAFLQAVRKNY